jgi:hypothetical protein
MEDVRETGEVDGTPDELNKLECEVSGDAYVVMGDNVAFGVDWNIREFQKLPYDVGKLSIGLQGVLKKGS